MKTEDFKFIEYQLYCFKRADKIIKDIEEEYIWKTNGSVAAWLRSINQDENTLEEQAQKITESKRIKEIKEWQGLINRVLVYFYTHKPTFYKFVKLKYFNLASEYEIKDFLKINDMEYTILKERVIFCIYLNALKEGLLNKKGVNKNGV